MSGYATLWWSTLCPPPDPTAHDELQLWLSGCTALLHKPEMGRVDPNPGRSYAMAVTNTVVGRPSCVKRLSKATRTCNSTT